MMTISDTHSRDFQAEIARCAERLSGWAVERAFGLWADRGVDRERGGFHEKLTLEGEPIDAHRRARVQPRQVFAFTRASALGWAGPAEGIVRNGISSMYGRYLRPDGLFHTLVDAHGVVRDDDAVLYDQAFVLLALAGASRLLGSEEPVVRAVAMRDAIAAAFGHRSGGFRSGVKAPLPLLANPHMHLFEACLAWVEAGGDPEWGAIADRIAGLALERMIEPASGALFEAFDEDWNRDGGIAGRVVEPGHQFEWAWLLLRWSELRGRGDARGAALRLIEVGERFGVDRARNVAVMELLHDMSVRSAIGRLWAQTERIKAGCLAARVTGDDGWLAGALGGCESVLAFLDDAPVAGLWRDQMDASGAFVEEAVPASTFYHIVVAIEEVRDFSAVRLRGV